MKGEGEGIVVIGVIGKSKQGTSGSLKEEDRSRQESKSGSVLEPPM